VKRLVIESISRIRESVVGGKAGAVLYSLLNELRALK